VTDRGRRREKASMGTREYFMTAIASLCLFSHPGCSQGTHGCADIHQGQPAVLSVPFVQQQSAGECGAACLAQVIGYWTHDRTFPAAVMEPSCPEGGCTGKQLTERARSRGFDALIFQGTLETLFNHLQAARPVIVMLGEEGTRHYSVVCGHSISEGAVVLQDPLRGCLSVDDDLFFEAWKASYFFTLVVTPQRKFQMNTPAAPCGECDPKGDSIQKGERS